MSLGIVNELKAVQINHNHINSASFYCGENGYPLLKGGAVVKTGQFVRERHSFEYGLAAQLQTHVFGFCIP